MSSNKKSQIQNQTYNIKNLGLLNKYNKKGKELRELKEKITKTCESNNFFKQKHPRSNKITFQQKQDSFKEIQQYLEIYDLFFNKNNALCCIYCRTPLERKYNQNNRSKNLEIDHLIPLSHNEGTNNRINTVPSCSCCNQIKGDTRIFDLKIGSVKQKELWKTIMTHGQLFKINRLEKMVLHQTQKDVKNNEFTMRDNGVLLDHYFKNIDSVVNIELKPYKKVSGEWTQCLKIGKSTSLYFKDYENIKERGFYWEKIQSIKKKIETEKKEKKVISLFLSLSFITHTRKN